MFKSLILALLISKIDAGGDPLPSTMGYKIRIREDNNIAFNVQLPKKSWIAFGFGEINADGDIVRIVTDASGGVTVEDLWVTGKGKPVIDSEGGVSSQDYTVKRQKLLDDGNIQALVERKMDTGKSDDKKLECGNDYKMYWAFADDAQKFDKLKGSEPFDLKIDADCKTETFGGADVPSPRRNGKKGGRGKLCGDANKEDPSCPDGFKCAKVKPVDPSQQGDRGRKRGDGEGKADSGGKTDGEGGGKKRGGRGKRGHGRLNCISNDMCDTELENQRGIKMKLVCSAEKLVFGLGAIFGATIGIIYCI